MVKKFISVKPPKNISQKDWFNWKWQLRSALKNKKDYETYLTLTPAEQKAFNVPSNFSTQTTPYYAQLVHSQNPSALRAIIIPNTKEQQTTSKQSLKDPLGEVHHSPVKHIIHRYPDRVVFLVTDLCPIYCRYCTRKRFTATYKKIIQTSEYQKALQYIKANPGIREVILSGGDPLTLADSILEKILKDLRTIQHVEIIRIGSRMPAVCPMRLSKKFATMIQKYHPIYIMSHFNHPTEVTQEAATALNIIADHGIPVYNQMVLINAVNNHPAIVQALSRRLLFLRVRPYYMFQCDPSLGTDHLRTSIKNSEWIQKSLWGILSGLAVPRWVVDIPGGGGKVELVPNCHTNKTNTSHNFTGWDNMTAPYIDPQETDIKTPPDVHKYLPEWNILCNQTYGNKLKNKI